MEQKKKQLRFGLILVTIGIVYGDIGTSPMYVMKSILEGNGGIGAIDQDFIIGSLSLVIWTITLLTTIKYVLIAMKADNHGEGGIFSLYSLVKQYGKALILPAMLGGAALLADGLLTPAVTVTTAVEGLRSIEAVDQLLGAGEWPVVGITLFIIFLLFFIQHAGTSSIGKAFGPVMLIWFAFLGVTGMMNIAALPAVLKAFNPIYAIRVLLSPANKAGFMILGSVFLATTGAEALYSDMGHVGKENIYASWPFVKLCLILNYLGQGAWIVLNRTNAALLASTTEINPFYMMLPEMMRPVAIVLGALAAIIASQALITGSYTLVSEAILLDLLPHLEIRYPADTKGQLYIPIVNHILWIGCSLVVLYFRSGARIEAAYGLAITLTMLMTTLLLTVYLAKLRRKPVLAGIVLVAFGVIETIFFISSLGKFTRGGYVTALLTLLLLAVMVIWWRGTELEHKYSRRLKIRDYIPNLDRLSHDPERDLLCNNLVYLGSGPDIETLDLDTLYSILDKDPKRAQAYWFVSMNVLNEPDTMTYQVETFGTDFIFRVRLDLGFKCNPLVNVYLRQIVQDLLESGELPNQEKKYSIYGDSTIGTFKFCVLRKSVPSTSELSQFDQFFLNTKYAIRRAAGQRVKWYGLDNSSIIIENVPLLTDASSAAVKRIVRIQ